MTSCLLVYIAVELGSGRCSIPHKTASKGLPSIFLKRNIWTVQWAPARQLAGFGPFIPRETATGPARGKATVLGSLGAHGSWTMGGWSVWAISGSLFSLWGPRWRACIRLLLSAAIFQLHILTCRQRSCLCSPVFHRCNKMPATWKREDLFWLMISGLSWGQATVGLWWGNVTKGRAE